jgi:ABC-type Na+ efflux pump permease subunit
LTIYAAIYDIGRGIEIANELLPPMTHAAVMIIALNLVISMLLSALTHAAIYDYRLEPGGSYYYRLDTRRNL